jgi:threonine synthase
VVVDPHTADGLHVGAAHRDRAVPLVCLETALPVKFGATIREALGRDPARPPAFEGIEQRPQRFVVLPADASKVKAIIEESAAA